MDYRVVFVGEDFGDVAGLDAVAGLAACFLAGTICSLLAASITFRIDDDSGGLKCGSCLTIVQPTTLESGKGTSNEIESDVKDTDSAAVLDEKV